MHHNVVIGSSVAGPLYFANKTPVDWHRKKQAAVETVACGSEHFSALICVEKILVKLHARV